MTARGAEFDQDNPPLDSPGPPECAAGSPADRAEVVLAAEYLRRHGLTVVATSWRCAYGVLDMVARDGYCTVFVQVTDASRPPEGWPFAVCRCVRRLALYWLAEQDDPLRQVRFDAVSVDMTGDPDPAIAHHRSVL